jgi:glycosyltransferase involved in cell wall biosynthesis
LHPRTTILHLSSTSGPGGAEMIVKRLACSLDPERFRSIVCLFRPGWLYDATRQCGIPASVIGIDGAFDLGWARDFAALLRNEKVDVIHAHEFTANTYGSLMGQLLGVPVVATVHGKNYFAEQAKRRMAYRYVSRVSRMVAVSADLKQFIVRRAGVSEDRVDVVYNGVDVADPTSHDQLSAIRKELNLSGYDHVIGSVGSLYPVKGHVHLIKALPEILRACPKTVLLLVGQGGLEQELKAEVIKRDLAAHVRFLGFRSDVPALLSLFDVFVLPSLSEGLSMALLEAMAAAKPVVATKVGGNSELVVDGDTGFLIDAESPDSVSDRVVRVLRDKARGACMGERGRHRVRGQFSFRTTVDNYQRYYELAARRDNLS